MFPTKLMLMMILIFSSALFAQTEIGTVAILDGDVWRLPGGSQEDKVKLERNAKIFESDTIVTGEDAFVKILMKDDTVFDLGDATKFSFEKFQLKTKKDRKAKYNFSYGKMRSIFTIKAKNEKDLQIKTPDVVMGVRGTEILADVYQLKGKMQTNIALVSGKLNIKMPSMKDISNSFDIKPGSMFNSQKMLKIKDFSKSMVKLKPMQMNQLKNVGIMKKGTFLYDTINKKPMPLNKEMQKMVKRTKDVNMEAQRENGGKRPPSKERPKNVEMQRENVRQQGMKELNPMQRKEFQHKMRDKLIDKIDNRRQRMKQIMRRRRGGGFRPPDATFKGGNLVPTHNYQKPSAGTYIPPQPPPPGT